VSGQASGDTAYLRAARSLRQFADLEQDSLDEAMHLAAPMAGGRLLDVGCGNKPYEPVFAPFVSEYVGAEFDETYSQSANARSGRADVVYSGDRLPFEDGAFDTVLCNQVGEHVPHPEAFFAELVRVVRTGGKLIFTVPFSYRIHSAPHDFHRFTKYALTTYAEQNGLSVDLLAARGGFWKVIGQKLASHLAFRVGRLESDVQRMGRMGYLREAERSPRYWVFPIIGPVVIGLVAAARLLDRIDHDDSDTLGYLLVATKR
jgi:SAM-dependent methyltransferase